MKQMIRWVLANAAFSAALWFGFVEGVQGAQNISVFLVWTLLPLSLLALHPEIQSTLAQRGGRSVSAWVDTSFDAAVLMFLLWHSVWLTGIAYALHMLLMAAVWHNVSKMTPENRAFIGAAG